MIKKIKNTVISKILLFIVILLGMALFSSIPMLIFNIDITNLSNLYQMLYLFSCDIGYIIIIYLIYRKSINKDFIDFFKNFLSNFELSFKYYVIGLIIMIVSNLLIFYLTDAVAGNEETVRTYIDNYPLYMFFSVSIYAPFIEEIIFRKSIKDIILYKHNNKISKIIYILSSGLIFAGMHLVGQITNPIDLLYIIPYASLGISFAALYCKTNNIFSTISIHCLHNTITIILYLFAGVI